MKIKRIIWSVVTSTIIIGMIDGVTTPPRIGYGESTAVGVAYSRDMAINKSAPSYEMSESAVDESYAIEDYATDGYAAGGYATEGYATGGAEPSSKAVMDTEEMAVQGYDGGGATAVIEGGASSTNTAVDDELKIIREAYIEIDVKDTKKTMKAIENKTNELKGYVESSNSYENRASGEIRRDGRMTLRVPSENYTSTIGFIGDLGKIVNESNNVTNVTLDYIDNEGQLKVKRIEEDRLLELISKADSIDAIVVLEARLSEIRSDIEYLTTTLRRWDNQVSMSTISISINERHTEIVEIEKESVLEDLSNALMVSFSDTGNIVINFVVWFISRWIKIAILAVIILQLYNRLLYRVYDKLKNEMVYYFQK